MRNEMNARVVQGLRDFMAEHEISQASVARHLDRSAAYVSKRMSGELDLTVDIMAAVADLARISPYALMAELTSRMLPR